MTIASLKIESNATARGEVLGAKDVRTLIAHQLGVDVKRVTDEAHFSDDLGADWLDRLELMIEIEAQVPNVEFTDEEVDQLEVVGDLIRHLKSARVAKGDDAAVASRERTIGLSTCSTPLTSRLRRAAEQLARSLAQWQNHFRLGSGIDYSHLA
jgi:acyl carrier protein